MSVAMLLMGEANILAEQKYLKCKCVTPAFQILLLCKNVQQQQLKGEATSQRRLPTVAEKCQHCIAATLPPCTRKVSIASMLCD